MEIEGLEVLPSDKGLVKGLLLRAIPYIGQYGENYRFMYPLTILKPTSKDTIKFLPPKVQQTITIFASKYPKGEIEFFVFNYAADDFLPSDPSIAIRLNYVVHPYVFYKCQGVSEDKTLVNMSLYKLHESDALYSSNEPSGIPINADNILDKGCLREVCIHPLDKTNIMCISPNNAAFKVAFTAPVLSFFSCCVVTFKDYGRLMVSLHTIFSDYEPILYRHVDSITGLGRLLAHISPERSEDVNEIARAYAEGTYTVFAKLEEYVRNAFGQAVEELLIEPVKIGKVETLDSTLFTLGLKLFKKDLANPKSSQREAFMAESFKRGFYKGKWAMAVQTSDQEDFIRSYVKDLPVDYYAKLLRAYMQEIIASYRETFDIQSKFLKGDLEQENVQEKYLDKEIVMRQETWFSKNGFIEVVHSKVAQNPDLKLLAEYMNLLLENKYEEAKGKFEQVNATIRNLIFYRTWVWKGKPMGIHSDFGRCAYMGMKAISEKFFMKTEEKLELISNIISELTMLDTN